MVRRKVKTLRAKGAQDVVVAAQATELDAEGERISCVISLRDSVVAASEDGNIRVYDRDTTGTARAVFGDHRMRTRCLAVLEDDLVLSVDVGGQIFTWRPSTSEVIGSSKVDELNMSLAVAKLDDERLIVGTGNGDLALLSHSGGTNLKMETMFRRKHSSIIRRFFVLNDFVFSCSLDKTVKIWDKCTLDHLATLQPEDDVNDFTLNNTHIVMVCNLGRIYVYRNAPPYDLDVVLSARRTNFILQPRCSSLSSVICLNPDIAMVAGFPGWVNFVSLHNKSFVARVKVSEHELTSLAVLSDSRIAAADCSGQCTLFYPPHRVRHAVDGYLTNKREMVVPQPEGIHPILNAWNCVQQQSLSVVDACETVIKSENTTRSLEEWCMGHMLLMQAVKSGGVLQSRDYKGTVLHWHRELYQHCDKLAIGEKDIGFLLSLFREAERAGVIAVGTSEVFISTVGIRNDIDKDMRYSANAIYQLFLRQAETDARLQQVLHYQNQQQLKTMVNAVLRTVPILGAVAGNAFTAGAAILNDPQVCGLVESLTGVSGDLSGGFGRDKLVGLFLRRGNEVLSEQHWNQLGEGNRRAVEDAAQSLGLTIGELRSRLLSAAEMANDGTEIVEVDEEVESGVEHGGITNEIANARRAVVSNPEASELNVNVNVNVNANAEGARAELEKWAKEFLNRESIEKLSGEEVATCLAAFLMSHDQRNISTYVRLKKALLDVFTEQFINGYSFVHADGREREKIIEAVMSAITAVAEGPACDFLGIRLKGFLQSVVESRGFYTWRHMLTITVIVLFGWMST